MTATGHCPVPVRPGRAKTSFPGREAAPLRFAAPSAWVQKGCWAGLHSAGAATLAASIRKEDRRPTSATRATGLRTLSQKKEKHGESSQRPVAAVAALSVCWLPRRGPARGEPRPSDVNLLHVLADGLGVAGHAFFPKQSIHAPHVLTVYHHFTAPQPATINPWITARNREPAASGFATS